jgi:prophage regulatory protein
VDKLIFNKAQLLQELDVAENTLRTLIEQRGFPHPRKMGAKLFWLVDEVLQWLQGCPRAWGGSAAQQNE